MQEDKIETDRHGTESLGAEKLVPKSFVTKFFSILKKHWKAVSVVVAVVAVIAIAFLAIPVVGVGGLKLVNLGASVRLESSQTAKLKGGNVSVEIAHFTNETCPTGKTCFGNARGVEYMLIVDGQKYATGSINTENASDYRIKTLSSDYKTYANIEITKSK